MDLPQIAHIVFMRCRLYNHPRRAFRGMVFPGLLAVRAAHERSPQLGLDRLSFELKCHPLSELQLSVQVVKGRERAQDRPT